MFNPSISGSTNRINLDQDGDSVNDYAFDSSGNTTKDADGRTFVYDAENKQVEVKNSSNETIGKYWYDGDGRRVKKLGWINGQWEETIFVYDASSRLVAEYSTILNPTPQVAYLTNDHLGSPRINTDENGAVIARHDYRPYGEEIAERTHAQYAADTIRKQFTSYERDFETDLDFAQARLYSKNFGRFTTTDPYNVILHTQSVGNYDEANRMLFEFITRPLHWNAYNYAMNNPLHFVDPTGRKEEISVRVNIVYDKNTIKTEEAAKELTAKIVADAERTYKTADIKLVVTYTAGTANTNEASIDNDQKIISGKIEGAVNVYISNDNSLITAAKSNTNSGESFINYGLHPSTLQPRQPDDGILSHELGHQFGVTAQTYGEAKAERMIESTNNYLRNGVSTENVETPVSGRNSTHVPQRSPKRELPLVEIYRNGAKRFQIR